MKSERLRKTDSLTTSTVRIRSDMKTVQGNYNDKISDLSILTKGELKSIIQTLEDNNTDKNSLNAANRVFDGIEEILINMDAIHNEMEELVSFVGGLEFSTDNTSDKLYEILQQQELQQTRMGSSIRGLIIEVKEVESGVANGSMLVEDIKELQLEFSRFQDFAIAAVPRMSKLFDELDNEEQLGEKYGNSKHI